MDKSKYKITIIGAGISGLIAAIILEQAGYHPVIIEASGRPGGRVKTDIINGYSLDRGFQVLLTAYPEASKYLDYKKLNLVSFLPGTQIFRDGKPSVIGDPTRNISLIFPTLLSGIGTMSDKLKILKLSNALKKSSIKEIFEEKEETTIDFLRRYGFSDDIIAQFFKPFFSGIFLEPDLRTSSRKFKFVYKMFGEGYAAIPKDGIEAMTSQLVNSLKHTQFVFDTKVKQVEEQKIILKSNQVIDSHFTIVAMDPTDIIPNLRNQAIAWKRCDTLYFETENRVINKNLIGLIADSDALINNIWYCNTSKNIDATSFVLSVTVVKKHQYDDATLIKKVISDLQQYCNIEVRQFIKLYKINKALPDVTNVQYEVPPSETRLSPSIFIAGDQQLNGSLNAAMISGERAAKGVIETLENGVLVEELTSEFN